PPDVQERIAAAPPGLPPGATGWRVRISGPGSPGKRPATRGTPVRPRGRCRSLSHLRMTGWVFPRDGRWMTGRVFPRARGNDRVLADPAERAAMVTGSDRCPVDHPHPPDEQRGGRSEPGDHPAPDPHGSERRPEAKQQCGWSADEPERGGGDDHRYPGIG